MVSRKFHVNRYIKILMPGNKFLLAVIITVEPLSGYPRGKGKWLATKEVDHLIEFVRNYRKAFYNCHIILVQNNVKGISASHEDDNKLEF